MRDRRTGHRPTRCALMRLAIADPPYPAFHGSGGRKNPASRWYGTGQLSSSDRPADRHPGAHEWDDPAKHSELLFILRASYDGWAIATCPDGIAAYGPLPPEVRIMAWIKPNAQPGSHRLRSMWEPVLVYPPVGRRSNRGGIGALPDVLTANAPRRGFTGQKPPEWTAWVLSALSYDPDADTVTDLFPGSGSVSSVIASYPNGVPE